MFQKITFSEIMEQSNSLKCSVISLQRIRNMLFCVGMQHTCGSSMAVVRERNGVLAKFPDSRCWTCISLLLFNSYPKDRK